MKVNPNRSEAGIYTIFALAAEWRPHAGEHGAPSWLVVVLQPKVGNQGFAFYVPERVLQLH
jgi:hypothetical protein